MALTKLSFMEFHFVASDRSHSHPITEPDGHKHEHMDNMLFACDRRLATAISVDTDGFGISQMFIVYIGE